MKPGRKWAYAGAILGGGVSIAANVAHSYVPPAKLPDGTRLAGEALSAWRPNTGAVLGAVFWPVALYVAIEILARVEWTSGRRWIALRFGGLVPVALVAGLVSYRHLSGLLAFYGEETSVTVLGPLAVDGLMVMAAGALRVTRRDALADASAIRQPDVSDASVINHVTPDASRVLVTSTADASPVERVKPDALVTSVTSDVRPVDDVTRQRMRHASRVDASEVVRQRDASPRVPWAEIASSLNTSVSTVQRAYRDARNKEESAS
jgi:hypothetical protein